MACNPCGICGVQVLDNDDAIQCDGNCGLWHHRECLGMTLDTYLNLSKECKDWVCKKCIVIIEQELKKECDQTQRLRSRAFNMRKSTKAAYEKLDFLTESQKCIFCNTSNRDEIKYGPIYSYKTIITHYYCLLLSSNMEQNGRDSDGILGFLHGDITKEARRGLKLYCSYCRTNGATLGCAVARCKIVFHLPCGLKNGTLHQFFGEFKSFCAKHRPVQKISEKILAESSKGAMCGICYEKVVPRPVHDTLWAPCCQKNGFFHRDCVQKLATSAGYFFKCPLCNNVEVFQKAMKDFGIFIPEQDASWERVPQAYEDLLARHDTCDSVGCKCPSGRKTNVSGTRWELILCKFCGSQGVHIGCGRLKWKCPEFECDTCADPSPDTEAGNRSYIGDRHRLTTGRASAIQPYVSPSALPRERERSSSPSSEESYSVEISSQRRRVVSPPSYHRPETPPTHYKNSNHNRNDTKLFDNPTTLDDMSRSILIDDSEEEIEVVGESNSGCLKTKDGSMIKVVTLSNVQKRLRVEGDVKVLPEEIVDITNQANVALQKPRVPSPPCKEVLYSFPTKTPVVSQASLPTAYSAPSTSYSAPSTSFVMIDPASLRQQDLPLNTVLYRSVQPIVSLPQAPVQTPIQSQHVPMQQLERQEPSCHKDAKHSDLGKYGTWSCNYLCPFHLQGNNKKASSRSLKHNHPGRRRRRNSGCYYNRLNPRVVISPLKTRVQDGYLEILSPRRNLSFSSMKRKASSLPYRPMKKVKITPDQEKIKRSRKRKLPEANLKIDKVEPEKKKKRKSLKKGDDDVANCTSSVIAELRKPPPSINLFKTLKLKWPQVSKLNQQKNTNCTINVESSKFSHEQTKKTKLVKRKKPLFEEWKCKRIDEYLTRCEKIPIVPTEQEKPEKHLNSDVCKGNEVLVVQTALDEIIDGIFTEITNENTCHFGESNPDVRNESVFLDSPDDKLEDHEASITVLDKISESPKNLKENRVSPSNSLLITYDSESWDKNVSFVENTSSKINLPTAETELSLSNFDIGCMSASPQKNTLVLEEPVLQGDISYKVAYKHLPPNDFTKHMQKKANFKNSSIGFFPKIKLSGCVLSKRNHCKGNKYSRKSKKTNNDVLEKESFNKQENKPMKNYKTCSSSKFLIKKGAENKVSIIDNYFSHLEKDISDFGPSLDTHKIIVGSSVNSLLEENKNDENSYSKRTPEKKPLVELQFSMHPFYGC